MAERATGVEKESVPCLHRHVVRTTEGSDHWWACDGCGDRFFHTTDLAEAVAQVAEENDAIIDTVTSVFTNTLWGLHQRALGDDVESMPDCDTEGHEPGPTGDCIRCGKSPFLGGGS